MKSPFISWRYPSVKHWDPPIWSSRRADEQPLPETLRRGLSQCSVPCPGNCGNSTKADQCVETWETQFRYVTMFGFFSFWILSHSESFFSRSMFEHLWSCAFLGDWWLGGSRDKFVQWTSLELKPKHPKPPLREISRFQVFVETKGVQHTTS